MAVVDRRGSVRNPLSRRFLLAFALIVLTTQSILSAVPIAAVGGMRAEQSEDLQAPCAGDCNAGGSVTVDELIRGVNIALGTLTLDACRVFDSSGDGRVTVAELVVAVIHALNGCPPAATPTPSPTSGMATPTVLSGLIEAPSFDLPAGAQAIATGDVIIRTTGSVSIRGSLRAAFPGGQSITIVAGGSITIDGAVGGGDATSPTAQSSFAPRGSLPESDGGDVIIQSQQDVALGPSAMLIAGDGGAGGKGGDIVLSAPNGTISVGSGDNSLHIGNGGDGIAVHEDAGASNLPDDLENGGGDSGVLIFDAPAVVGTVTTRATLVLPYEAELGDLALPAGKEVFITTSASLLSGGRGGDAGAFDFSPDGSGGGFIPRGDLSGLVTRRGAPGGDGFLVGGGGGDVGLRGRDATVPGGNGQSVSGLGGAGGVCPPLFDLKACLPGRGGDAQVVGGRGAPGSPAGNGGSASAAGGDSPGDLAVAEKSTVHGRGGDAEATGGDGGHGLDACPPLPGAVGGAGGNGGGAAASGGNAFTFVADEQRGFTLALGGAGGNGGDGVPAGGAGGTGGTAAFLHPANELRMGAEALQGAPGQPGAMCRLLPTATPTSTRTPTRTSSPTPASTGPVRVVLVTGTAVGAPSKPVMSFGIPVIAPLAAPSGYVLVSADLGTNEADQVHALLRLRDNGARSVLLADGQSVPGSQHVVRNVGSPSANFAGSFALVETDIGASIVQVNDDGVVTPVLGVGADGTRSLFDPHSYVLSDAVFAYVSDIDDKPAVVGAFPGTTAPPIRIVSQDDPFPYFTNTGVRVIGTVTDVSAVEPVFVQSGGGTVKFTVDGSREILGVFSYTGNMLQELVAGPLQGNRAPGFAEDVNIAEFGSGARLGGGAARGFRTLVAGEGIDANNDELAFVMDSSFRFGVLVQEGTSVPGSPAAVFGSVQAPVMGPNVAAVVHQQNDQAGTYGAIGLASYGAFSFRTAVAAGAAAPGGGVFADFTSAVAINEAGLMVFLAELEGGGSAYFVADANAPVTQPRRLIGTGDPISLPGGTMATVAALDMIPASAGLGGEASAVNATHVAIRATLDDQRQAILVVALQP